MKPRVRSSSARKTWQLVQALHVERERALRPVDLPLEGVAATEREPRRLERADGAVREPDRRLDRVVDLAPLDERAQEASDLVDLADEVAGEVDDVSSEIAERTRARLGAVEAPDLGVGVAPVLQIAPAEVTNLAEVAGVDQLPCEPNGRDEAVVERAQVLYAGRSDAAPDLVALVRIPAERLRDERRTKPPTSSMSPTR